MDDETVDDEYICKSVHGTARVACFQNRNETDTRGDEREEGTVCLFHQMRSEIGGGMAKVEGLERPVRLVGHDCPRVDHFILLFFPGTFAIAHLTRAQCLDEVWDRCQTPVLVRSGTVSKRSAEAADERLRLA
ncbi:hypothetical protein DCS_06228 [Drechmeria coniospora]|uniref:Uncharacterized protein n=1 Tax=Drechmeria coniospora TaxID=98403 RepID=A0A151GB54_DRECN|nr:hypothetical protein DCS_06228 [Drechmeria coniospora]KYK54271.1 hypothetical protein DCS_06228 [Drechmeria coniospora]